MNANDYQQQAGRTLIGAPDNEPGNLEVMLVMCDDGDHDFYEGYYGTSCRKCGWFAPYGCAPWDVPTYEEQAWIDAEEYANSHGVCAFCGGEWGDGWSSCVCEREDHEDHALKIDTRFPDGFTPAAANGRDTARERAALRGDGER